jgi:hypothetical protein
VTIGEMDVLASPREGRQLSALPDLKPPSGSVNIESAPDIGHLVHATASGLAIDVPQKQGEWTLSADADVAGSLHDLVLVVTYTVKPTPS